MTSNATWWTHVRYSFAALMLLLLGTSCLRADQPSLELVADAGEDQVVTVGAMVHLRGRANDGEGRPRPEATYAWAFVQRPDESEAGLADANASETTFVADAAGRYELELVVSAGGANATDRVSVHAEAGGLDGVRFEGDPETLVLDATYDLSLPMVATEEDVSVIEEDGIETRVLRTELELGFVLDATVGEVNALLEAHEAWIVDMLPDQRQMTVRIPDPGSFPELVALIERLEADPVVDFALLDVVLEEDQHVERLVLPPAFGSRWTRIDHHLAARAHAAWNLRDALPGITERPFLVIADLFGAGVLVFALDPSLTGPEVVALLAATAQAAPTSTLTRGTVACNAVTPAPVVDAYAAVVAAGGDAAWTSLFDVNADGVFDEADLLAFVEAYAALGATLDYSRFDLSGDGRTGELLRSERLDLDGDGVYGTVTRTIVDASGATRTRTYDEVAVHDYDVLCYHAYGPLYAGDEGARELLIGDLCAGNPRLRIVEPAHGSVESGTVSFRAVLEPPLEQPDGDVSGYTIYWSYPRQSGETVHLGTTVSGAALDAHPVCPDVLVTAQARRGNEPRALDRVAFTHVNPVTGRWEVVLTSPATHTLHVDALALTAGVTLEGIARRMVCDGYVTSPEFLRWFDEVGGVLGAGPTLTLGEPFFADGGGFRDRIVRLEREGVDVGTSVRIVPCSSQPGSGLFPCPDIWQELRDDLVDKHRVLTELLESGLMRDRVLADLGASFGTALPIPFPPAAPQLLDELASTLPSLLHLLLQELLLETLTSANLAEFDASVRDLERSAAGMLPANDLAFLGRAVTVATATAAFFAPVEVGGDGGFGVYPFADAGAVAAADPLTPAEHALRGFLSAYLASNDGSFGVGTYDLELGLAVAVDAAILGALGALEASANGSFSSCEAAGPRSRCAAPGSVDRRADQLTTERISRTPSGSVDRRAGQLTTERMKASVSADAFCMTSLMTPPKRRATKPLFMRAT